MENQTITTAEQLKVWKETYPELYSKVFARFGRKCKVYRPIGLYEIDGMTSYNSQSLAAWYCVKEMSKKIK